MSYDAFIRRCQDRFAFLEGLGLAAVEPWVDAPRECGMAWRGPAGSVEVLAEYHGPPSIAVRAGGGERLGLHEALPLLDPDREPPADPSAAVDFWADFLRERWSDLLDPALLDRIRRERERARDGWCGAFFDEARRAFAFLVEAHGYAEPLPSASPTQCTLTWHAPPRWVLVHRTEGRDAASPTRAAPVGHAAGEGPAEIGVWVEPGGGHLDLAPLLAERGSPPGDLAAAAAFLRAHPELLGVERDGA